MAPSVYAARVLDNWRRFGDDSCAMDWGDSKTIRTPEHVAVTYTLAGLGTRFAAMCIDSLLQGLVVLIWVLVAGGGAFEAAAHTDADLSPWLAAVIFLALFALIWGYFIFWETVWNGQTPGKYLCGLRVIRDGGFPIDFRAAFIRNILRYIDMLPFCYGVGVLTMFLSKDSKRLGDYAAGTLVIINPARARKPAPAPTPFPSGYKLLGDPSVLNLRAVSREQFLVIERFLSRRNELPENVRRELAQQMAAPLFPLLGLSPPVPPYPYESFLFEFADAYRRRPGT